MVPVPELVTLGLAVSLSLAIWAAMRYTDLGKALRAMAEDAPIAAAFGINQRAMSLLLAGLCAALAGVAGICLALTFALTPSQIFAWVGVVFAAVMLGGLWRASSRWGNKWRSAGRSAPRPRTSWSRATRTPQGFPPRAPASWWR